jgi:hypothetical protein
MCPKPARELLFADVLGQPEEIRSVAFLEETADQEGLVLRELYGTLAVVRQESAGRCSERN